jgi:hypothetical protein
MARGETLRYEFYYQPGQSLVHPALDRLTFLLDPAGVRMHWMTDGTYLPADELKPDNAWDEPEYRRGPSSLPLKPGEWNELELALSDDRVALRLNSEPIYERPLPESNNRLFGLFHYKDQTVAEVRNVVLSGDWPRSLTPDQLADLAAVVDDSALSVQERQQRTMLIGEQFIRHEAEEVAKAASELPPAERYARLLDWVLPSDAHA